MEGLAQCIVFVDVQRHIHQCSDCPGKVFIADNDLTCKCGGFHCTEHIVNYNAPDHLRVTPLELAPPVEFRPLVPPPVVPNPGTSKSLVPKPKAPPKVNKVNKIKVPKTGTGPKLGASNGKPGRKPASTVAKQPPPADFDPQKLNPNKSGGTENAYSVLELREILRHMGLSMTGQKQELINRIQMNLPAQTE
jgi:hypothetical protein